MDTVLGPEMKSTGEALGSDVNLEKALYKALVASGIQIPMHGNVLMTIRQRGQAGGAAAGKTLCEHRLRHLCD